MVRAQLTTVDQPAWELFGREAQRLPDLLDQLIVFHEFGQYFFERQPGPADSPADQIGDRTVRFGPVEKLGSLFQAGNCVGTTANRAGTAGGTRILGRGHGRLLRGISGGGGLIQPPSAFQNAVYEYANVIDGAAKLLPRRPLISKLLVKIDFELVDFGQAGINVGQQRLIEGNGSCVDGGVEELPLLLAVGCPAD